MPVTERTQHFFKDPYWRRIVETYLPEKFHHLFEEYPSSLVNAASAIEEKERPFDSEYKPDAIEIYFADSPGYPHLCFEDGELVEHRMDGVPQPVEVIKIFIDSTCSYVQVGGEVLLNNLGGMPMPEVFHDREALERAISRL